MAKVKVEVLTGPQGGGKSALMKDEAIATPGLYLFAVPTIELIEEQVNDFFSKAPGLVVRAVHSTSPGRGSVKRKLAETQGDMSARGVSHAVVLVTHETMMDADFAAFDGWHARIDEAPAAVQAGRMNIRVSRRHFEESYDLSTIPESDWSAVHRKGSGFGWNEIARDTLAKPLGEFEKQVGRSNTAFVRCRSWADGDEIDWFSMWTPLNLSNFATVTVAGSSYTESVGYRAARAILDDLLDFHQRPVLVPRSGQPQVAIHYFTEGHHGSTSFWGTSEGRWCIKQVADHLAGALDDGAYWSGNEVVQHLMEHRIPGRLIKPVAAGVNKHRTRRSCAFTFSGKATPNDRALMEAFGLTSDEIRRSREDDAVSQFAMRGAIRNSDYDGPYDIYLYEREQAARLEQHLRKIGFADVTMVGASDAGILATKRAGQQPRAAPDDQAARERKRREDAAARSKANRAKKARAAGREPGQPGNPGLRRK